MVQYKAIEEKGHGAFARVMIVEDEHGKRFAKKIFSPMPHILDTVGEAHLKKRFKREVKYQSQVKHRNVVPVVEYELDNEVLSFIMPLAECSLQDELRSDTLSGATCKKALFDVLTGLECLHDHGYTHRDLKPANILKFKSASGDFYYAIGDFGLMSVAQTDSSTLTMSNTRGGTENYAAPEQIKNFKAATPSADIYSFGALLHDIFGQGARRIPYTELSLPGPIGTIIAKCTKVIPDQRYKSISTLRNELYPILDDSVLEFSSPDEEAMVKSLQENSRLSHEDWDDILIALEKQVEELHGGKNIFYAISEQHLDQLKNEIPELFNALGHYFAEFIAGNTFDFDYCDILAGKAEKFYKGGGLEIKAEIVLALLKLGTAHNRWYVERKFLQLAGSDISVNLAKRIISEIEVENINFAILISRLEASINASRKELHPLLLEFIDGAGQ